MQANKMHAVELEDCITRDKTTYHIRRDYVEKRALYELFGDYIHRTLPREGQGS